MGNVNILRRLMWNDLENVEAVAAFWFALIFLLPILLSVIALVSLLALILLSSISGIWDALKKIFKLYL